MNIILYYSITEPYSSSCWTAHRLCANTVVRSFKKFSKPGRRGGQSGRCEETKVRLIYDACRVVHVSIRVPSCGPVARNTATSDEVCILPRRK